MVDWLYTSIIWIYGHLFPGSQSNYFTKWLPFNPTAQYVNVLPNAEQAGGKTIYLAGGWQRWFQACPNCISESMMQIWYRVRYSFFLHVLILSGHWSEVNQLLTCTDNIKVHSSKRKAVHCKYIFSWHKSEGDWIIQNCAAFLSSGIDEALHQRWWSVTQAASRWFYMLARPEVYTCQDNVHQILA